MIATVLDFPHCTLVIEREGEKRYFDLTGDLDQVGPGDRERIAAALAQGIDVSHEESYRMLWSTDDSTGECHDE